MVVAMGLATWIVGCQDDGEDKAAPDDSTGGATSQQEGDSGGGPSGTPDYEGGDRFVTHDDALIADLDENAIERAKAELHVVYQHTSHGSQLVTGMNSLASYPDYGDRYAWSDAGEGAALDLDDNGIPADVADLSQGDYEDDAGDTPWAIGTRTLLDDPENAHVNVVMWSWCSINGHDAQRYVDNMEKLIAQYPDVTFVFMTGHAEGDGEDMTENGVHYNNQLIRKHCRDHNRWLYDFADIEARDPDGNYYWDAAMRDNLDYDGGNWAVEWIAANPEHDYARLTTGEGVEGFDGTSGCAHSNSPAEANLNCAMKGVAAWSLFARLAAQDQSAD
jgi:hypothetical protein